MKKMKRILAVTLALVLAMAMMTGCGKKDTPAETTPTPAESTEPTEGTESTEPVVESEEPAAPAAEVKECTLRVNTEMAGTDAAVPVFEEVLEQFKADYPQVTVEDESAQATEESKATFVANFTMDNEPDVVQWFCDVNSDPIIKMNKVVSLEEMQAYNSEIGKDLTEGAINAAASLVDGKTYFIPTTGFTEGLFVNTDIFEENNLELPTDWAKFMTAIETLSAKEIVPIAISLNAEPHYLVEQLLLNMSGYDLYTSVPETAPQEWVDAISLLKDMRDKGAFPKDTDSIDEPAARDMFYQAKAAMICDGSWIAGGVPQDRIEKVKFMPLPIPDGGKNDGTAGIAGFTSGFTISRKAWEDPNKKEAAVQLLLALTNKETTIKYWQKTGAAACAVPTTEEDMASLDSLAKQMTEVSASFTKPANPTDARIAGEPWATFISKITPISKGKADAKQAIQDMLDLYKKNSEQTN